MVPCLASSSAPARWLSLHSLAGSQTAGGPWAPDPRLWELQGASECLNHALLSPAHPVRSGLWHQSHQTPKLRVKVHCGGMSVWLWGARWIWSGWPWRLAHGAKAALIWSPPPLLHLVPVQAREFSWPGFSCRGWGTWRYWRHKSPHSRQGMETCIPHAGGSISLPSTASPR